MWVRTIVFVLVDAQIILKVGSNALPLHTGMTERIRERARLQARLVQPVVVQLTTAATSSTIDKVHVCV